MFKILTNRALWEQPYVDLWALPHLLFGTLLALTIQSLRDKPWVGVGTSIILAIGWEWFENITAISDAEFFTNQITDVVLAPLGFLLGLLLLKKYPSQLNEKKILAIVGSIFLFITLAGWFAYQYYTKTI